jgi:aspartyl/asparaginyl-tRNA synthetase
VALFWLIRYLHAAACEGTTTLFEVGYFDDKAYLTQSGQPLQ